MRYAHTPTIPHSPLPWSASQTPRTWPIIQDANGINILKTDCSTSLGRWETNSDLANANARLARAAGAMYAALKLARLGIHPDDDYGPCRCSQCEFSKAAAEAIELAEAPL